jgi:hypothetical protein
MLLAISAFVQGQSAGLPSACGPEKVSFKVKLDDTQHTLAQPEPGKARVYFIDDAGTTHTLGFPTSILGIDGEWVGANHGNSYFSVFVEPGEHHLCAALQYAHVDQRVELAHLRAETGRVYYYRTRLWGEFSYTGYLELDPIDSDQAKYLIGLSPLSVSKSTVQHAVRQSGPRDTR